MRNFKPLLAMATTDIPKNLRDISQRVKSCYEQADPVKKALREPRLVAVSKTKPKEMIIAAYDAGHRVFGENYINELEEKSNDSEILEKCPDIAWHFIGTCQTKSTGKLLKARNLHVMETVTSIKLADKLQRSCDVAKTSFNIMVQVNTSGEENKGGVSPSEATQLVEHVIKNCPKLKFTGLMTIGALGNSLAQEGEENPDFLKLLQCRKEVAEKINLKESELELSMGMSNDFEEAIRMGSTNVRVGSSIFGARNYAKPDSEDTQLSDKMTNVKVS